jgi:chromosomal replication initiator protein
MSNFVNKESIHNHLLKNHKDVNLQDWFDPLRLYFSSAGTIEVRFPHVLFSRWFDKDRRKTFEREVCLALGFHPRIIYTTPENTPLQPMNFPVHAYFQENRSKQRSLPKDIGGQWSFATFIYNKKNKFAVSMARELAAQPKTPSHVPLVITGEGTCDKTHILRAIAREIASTLPEDSVYFGTAAELNTYFRECADSVIFKKKILRKKAIFIDDTNDLSDYPELQQEMVFVTDTFKNKNKPLVLAVDSNLDHENIDRQLRSRLLGGLVITLKRPDLDIRLRYAKTQCSLLRLHLKKDHLLPIVQRFNNFRVIQGVITKIAAYEKKSVKPVSTPNYRKYSRDTTRSCVSRLLPGLSSPMWPKFFL